MELFTDLHRRNVVGKENLEIGKAWLNGPEILCPVTTSTALATDEQPELRAYKLGKQKCSYNQVELEFKDITVAGKASHMRVSEAIETVVGTEVDEPLRESCLKFNVRFLNNNRVHLYIYVVYASPYCSSQGGEKNSLRYHWVPVTRSKCKKGCTGPVIRGLQRFGRMSRRGTAINGHEGEDAWKEPRHLYIAIDEASTHVCARPETSKFRLLVAAYDEKYELLGTTISSSIRVLANNDAPLGAASIKLHCNLKGGRSLSPPHLLGITERICCRVPLQDIAQNSLPAGQKISNGEEAESSHDTSNVPQVAVESTSPSLEIQDPACLKPSSNLKEGTKFFEGNSASILTSICQRLFELYALDTAVILNSTDIATALGCERHQIAVIFDILQCIDLVQQEGKGKYIWKDRRRVSQALDRIKMKVLYRMVDDSQSPDKIENSSRFLCEQLIQFLSANENNRVSWERVVDTIFPSGQFTSRILERSSAQFKKLCEVACILSSLHLIAMRNAEKSELRMGPVLQWIGVQGVARYLAAYGGLNCEQRTPKRTGATKQNPSLATNKRRASCYMQAKRKTNHYSDGEDDASSMKRKREEEETCQLPPRKRTRRNLLLLASCCDSIGRVSEPLKSTSICTRTAIPRKSQRADFTDNAGEYRTFSETEDDESKATEAEQVNVDAQQHETPANSGLEEEMNVSYRARQEEDEPMCTRVLTQYPINDHSSFDPFYYLEMLFSSEQVATIERDNPAFLFDFVRYSRQLHHTFSCSRMGAIADSGIVTCRPVPRRLTPTFRLRSCSTGSSATSGSTTCSSNTSYHYNL